VQARARVEAANAKAKDRISDLQEFVRRFSANASKARQATSRKKQLEKIKIEEIRPSSRQNPYIRFEQGKKLYRNAFSVEKLSFGYPDTDELVLEGRQSQHRGRRAYCHHRAEWRGQDDLDALLAGELRPTPGKSCGWRMRSPAICRRIRRPSSRTRPICSAGCHSTRARRTMIKSCARPSVDCCSPAKRPRSR
jgi:ATPase subunit of ABC transporter with duplicated ATPase domains